MELNKFYHESIIGASDSSFLLHELLSFFIIAAHLEDDISDDNSHRSRYSLDAVNQNILLAFYVLLDEVYRSVEKTFDVFILGVLQKICQVCHLSILEPIFTVISSTVDDTFDLVFFNGFPTFSYFFPSHKNTLHNLSAISFKFFHLKLMSGSDSNIKFYFSILLLFLNSRIRNFLIRFQTEL